MNADTEHKCGKIPYQFVVRYSEHSGVWLASTTLGGGVYDIKYCPWCGKELS
jgi:hypothetical protein